MLEMLLEIGDSSMTYRSRYFTTMQTAPVLDLLMNDEANPRSLAFQLRDLSKHSKVLAKTLQGAEWPASETDQSGRGRRESVQRRCATALRAGRRRIAVVSG